MRFHYNGEIAPLMEVVFFVDADAEILANIMFEGAKKNPHPNISVEKKYLTGSLKDVILQTMPYLYPKKILFIPTKSNFTAYTNNDMDVESGARYIVAKQLNKKVINVIVYINMFGKVVNGWGGGVFSYYSEDYHNPKRLLELSWDGKWGFHQYGEPLPFEEIDKYKEKSAKDRFTPEMLDDYCKHFGIDFFNEDFYMPQGSRSIMIQYNFKDLKGNKPISLEEHREHYGLSFKNKQDKHE
jgi:hypothetical protein